MEQLEKDTHLFLPTVAVVEFFSFPRMNPHIQQAFEALLTHLRIMPLDYSLSLVAAEVRRSYKLKLGDSVVAATALYTHSALLTRNTRDFKKIRDLQLVTL